MTAVLSRRGIVALLMLLAVSAGALGLLIGAGSSGRTRPAPGLRASALPTVLERRPAPRFSVRDALGTRVDTARLRGRPYAVTFLYTRCPDVCPVIAQELKQALAQVGTGARDVRLVAVSVDPDGDTRQAVRRWARRQAMPRQMQYAIGSRRELEPIWRGYYAAPQVSGRPETSLHTATVWLVDARGRLRGRYPAGIPLEPADIAHDLRVLLAERRG